MAQPPSRAVLLFGAGIKLKKNCGISMMTMMTMMTPTVRRASKKNTHLSTYSDLRVGIKSHLSDMHSH